MVTLEVLEQEATRQVDYAWKFIKEFSAKVLVEPAHAAEWYSDGLAVRSARLSVWKKILEAKGHYMAELTEPEIINGWKERASQYVTNGARWPKHSTSVTSNFFAECLTSAWTELYCFLNEQF